MELLGDLFTLFLLIVATYAFLPEALRGSLRGGVGPVVSTIADGVRAAVPTIERIAYQIIVGRPREVSSVSAEEMPSSEPIELPNNVTEDDESTERTNEPERSALFRAAERVQLDRTRSALIALLVVSGWQTVDIRNTLKGTASDFGDEIRAARVELAGNADMLVVREGSNERLIVK